MNTHKVKIETFIADTDYSGVIYHANYLKYMDYARTVWLKEAGYCLHELAEQGNHFVVSHIDIKYLKPAGLSSELAVLTQLEQARGASMQVQQWITAWQDQEQLYVKAQVKLAYVNNEFKPQRILAEFRN